jgi:hypothetical protein
LTPIHRCLARFDGGQPRDLRDMGDAQLDRLITRAMTPAQPEKYRNGTPEQIDALLAVIVAEG